MRNYVASTTVNFEGSKFYVRPGDMLAHGAQHGNSLAVYRNGQLVKVLKVDSLVIEAFLKSGFITEVRRQPAKKAAPAPVLTKKQADAYPSDVGVAVVNGKLKVGNITPETLADAYVKITSELGITPTAQADMDSLAKQHDELMDQPPKPEKRRKPKPAAEIDFAVHPPDPPPTQVLGPDEEAPPPLRDQAEM